MAKYIDAERYINNLRELRTGDKDTVYEYYDDGIDVAISEAATFPAADVAPRWIPVTERLPEEICDSYWVCTDSGYQCECRWTNINSFWVNLTTDWHWNIFDIPQYTSVIAWMPLPTPYKGGEEE